MLRSISSTVGATWSRSWIARRRGAEDGDRPARHQDVAVAGGPQPVDDVAGHPVVVDQQRALGIQQIDVGTAGEAGDVHRPGAPRVDDLPGAYRQRREGPVVATDGGADLAVDDLETQQLGVGTVEAAVGEPGVIDVRQREVKGIDGGVGNPAGPDQAVREVRLELARLGDGQLVAADTRAPAELGKFVGERRIIALDGDEQATGRLDAMRRQPLQQLVFLPAFDRRFEVGGDVAGARVQETVVAARGAGAEVDLVDEDGVDAAQREVAHDPGAGHPAADDQHLRLEGRCRRGCGLLGEDRAHGSQGPVVARAAAVVGCAVGSIAALARRSLPCRRANADPVSRSRPGDPARGSGARSCRGCPATGTSGSRSGRRRSRRRRSGRCPRSGSGSCGRA